MKIEYELKFFDYFVFNVLHQFLSWPIQLFIVGCALLSGLITSGDEMAALPVVTAVVAYAAIWAIQIVFLLFYLCFGSYRSLLTKHIAEIQDDAFYKETKFGRSYEFWSGVVKVVGRPGFIGVYLNGNAAHIIPNRAFSSSDQRHAFFTALQGKLCAS